MLYLYTDIQRFQFPTSTLLLNSYERWTAPILNSLLTIPI